LRTTRCDVREQGSGRATDKKNDKAEGAECSHLADMGSAVPKNWTMSSSVVTRSSGKFEKAADRQPARFVTLGWGGEGERKMEARMVNHENAVREVSFIACNPHWLTAGCSTLDV